MTDLKKHYTELYERTKDTVLREGFSYDETILIPEDTRHGLTLIIRIDDQGIREQLSSFYEESRAVAPDCYCYPFSDLHITVLSIIECQQDLSISDAEIDKHQELLREGISETEPFDITFEGITASPSCIMIQGFCDTTLNDLRDRIRKTYAKHPEIDHTIDSRYRIDIAHSTVVRFLGPVNERSRMIDLMDENRERYFGKIRVRSVDLVTNDWCMTAEKTILQEEYTF